MTEKRIILFLKLFIYIFVVRRTLIEKQGGVLAEIQTNNLLQKDQEVYSCTKLTCYRSYSNVFIYDASR
jgi:hypothetical protein